MQLFQDQLLQFVGGFTLFCVDARLGEKRLGIDAGLLEQEAKAVILRGQMFLGRGAVVLPFGSTGELFAGGATLSTGIILQRSLPNHVLQLRDHLRHFQWLAMEAASARACPVP